MSDSLRQNIPVMLLYVLESKGSSPGRQGFFMAVNARGDMAGSIGGGIMEHKFVELAKEKLQSANSELQVRKQVHSKSASKDRSGMICAGEQTVLIYPLRADEKETVDEIIEVLNKNINGTLHILPGGISLTNNLPTQDYFYEFKSETDWQYREKVGYKNQLYIIGGGHCSLAFSKIMSMMDFYIHVYEERQGLNTIEQNTWAHEKTVIKNYEELNSLIGSDPNGFVVIMSFGYRTDAIVLRALFGKEFRYLGLLGSKKKTEEMFNDFRQEGISDETLKKIHAPIGISIKSQTPEEIAISIAAEIIAIKNS